MIEIKGKLTEPLFVDTPMLIVALIIVLAIPIALYVLRTIGVYSLAKKANLKTAFLAFFPGLWVYPFAMLVKEAKFFNSKISKWAIAFAVLATASIVVTVAYNFLIYFPLVGNILEGRIIYRALDADMATHFGGMGYVAYPALSGVYVNTQTTAINGAFVYPYEFVFIEKWLNMLYMAMEILDLIVTIIKITLFINVFRKYWPQHFLLATILSIFGLFPIFAFVIRNKKPVNYFEFLNSRYQSTYGPYGPYGANGPRGPYSQGPFTQSNGNPYNNPYANVQNEPFQDFEPKQKRVEEPFSEFNSNDKKDEN